ncbi:MAG: hypothetical protein QM608_12060 [Caulobacter sp.]
MGFKTWTAVFTLSDIQDPPEEIEVAINGFIGAELQRRIRPLLVAKGWGFEAATAEDHGWHASAALDDDGKRITASLVTGPELEAAPDGRALEDRWRVVIGLDLGLLPRTKTRRTALMTRLARDVDDACRALGAVDMDWENGALSAG